LPLKSDEKRGVLTVGERAQELAEEIAALQQWIAASNALSRLRAPGFAASILSGLTLRHGYLVSIMVNSPAGDAFSKCSGWANATRAGRFSPRSELLLWSTAPET